MCIWSMHIIPNVSCVVGMETLGNTKPKLAVTSGPLEKSLPTPDLRDHSPHSSMLRLLCLWNL